MSYRLRWIPVLLVVMLLAGGACSTQQAESPVPGGTTTGTGMDIEFLNGTIPPVAGDNDFEVIVKRNGTPVDDATVTIMFSMPAMPSMNMPEMHSSAALQPVGKGRYRATGRLSMQGTWNVRVTATRNGRELGTRNLSIVVR